MFEFFYKLSENDYFVVCLFVVGDFISYCFLLVVNCVY